MYNPFSERYNSDKTDENLIEEAVSGNRDALEILIRRHQDWIYNMALRMVFYPDDAKDITQEVLIKIITKLATFEKRSSFRTWVYRIVVNHILNMKKSRGELNHNSNYRDYWKSIERTPDFNLPELAYNNIETKLLADEVRISCMFGMLLCLDRMQRITYILGGIFGASDKIGAEILEISRENFRQKLSRARKELHNFMNEKCGLIKRDNPCHCTKKMKALVDCGYVNPASLKFNTNYMYNIRQAAERNIPAVSDYLDEKCRELFVEHPFQNAPDFVMTLREILDSTKFKELFNLN